MSQPGYDQPFLVGFASGDQSKDVLCDRLPEQKGVRAAYAIGLLLARYHTPVKMSRYGAIWVTKGLLPERLPGALGEQAKAKKLRNIKYIL